MREQFVLQIVVQTAELGVEVFVKENCPTHDRKLCHKNHMLSIAVLRLGADEQLLLEGQVRLMQAGCCPSPPAQARWRCA